MTTHNHEMNESKKKTKKSGALKEPDTKAQLTECEKCAKNKELA